MHVEEQQLVATGIKGGVPVIHPAVLAIHRWIERPSTETERVYRWMDAEIASVFGSLISRGEFLRAVTLNLSFAATIGAFLVATSGGHDIDRMLAEVSGAMGATLVGLALWTIESATLARLNAEAVRLEFEGRELVDIWAADRFAFKRKTKALAADEVCLAIEEKTYANAS